MDKCIILYNEDDPDGYLILNLDNVLEIDKSPECEYNSRNSWCIYTKTRKSPLQLIFNDFECYKKRGESLDRFLNKPNCDFMIDAIEDDDCNYLVQE